MSDYGLVYNTLNKFNRARNEINARTNNYIFNLISNVNNAKKESMINKDNTITFVNINNYPLDKTEKFYVFYSGNDLYIYLQLQKTEHYVFSMINYNSNTKVFLFSKNTTGVFANPKNIGTYQFFCPGENIEGLIRITNPYPYAEQVPSIFLFTSDAPYTVDNYGQITGVKDTPLEVWKDIEVDDTIQDDETLINLLNNTPVNISINNNNLQITLPTNESLVNYFTNEYNKLSQLDTLDKNDTIDFLTLIPWRDELVEHTKTSCHCVKKKSQPSYKNYSARYTCLYGAKDFANSRHLKMALPLLNISSSIWSININSTNLLTKKQVYSYPAFASRIKSNTNKRGNFRTSTFQDGTTFEGRTTIWTTNPINAARLMPRGCSLKKYNNTTIETKKTLIRITDTLTKKTYSMYCAPFNGLSYSWGIVRVTKQMLLLNQDTGLTGGKEDLQYWKFTRHVWDRAPQFQPENFKGSMSSTILTPVDFSATFNGNITTCIYYNTLVNLSAENGFIITKNSQ